MDMTVFQRRMKVLRVLRRFFLNGIIMTATSLAMRAVGVAWNAFISAKLGAQGMGLFTLIMSVYGLSVTVASSGVNLAATRMCAEAIGCSDESRLRGALRRCLTYAAVCGTAAFLLLFFGAGWVAEGWLEDARCTASLRLLAISLPFIAASNVLHGYFNAVRRVAKSAAVQIFEQFVKISVTVWLLLQVMPDGVEYAGVEYAGVEYAGVEYACIALVGGGALAECASFTLALILYLLDRRYAGKRLQTCKSDISCSHEAASLTRELFGITVPVAAAAYVRSGLTTLEHMLIPRGLRANPATADAALALYGVLCGMVMPVVLFPTALLYSFTGLLVPEFSEAEARGDRIRIRSMVSRALGMTLIFAIGCAGVMMQFSGELGRLIYNSGDAGQLIRVMAPLIPVMYLDHAVDAMLKGLGEQLYSMKVNILDAAMCTLLVWLLCPRIGIWGYVVTIYIAEAVNASLSLYRLAKVTDFTAGIAKTLIGPLLCAVGAVLLARLFGFAACAGWGQLVLGCTCTVLLYAVLLILFGVVTRRDLHWAAGILR